jgi:predicted lipid-binding transport protein (Tim44 family)
MTSAGRPPQDQRTTQADKAPSPRSGWLMLLVAVPVLCCAGPLFLATLGAGSLTVGIGAGTGQVALALSGLILIVLAVAIRKIRRKRRKQVQPPIAQSDQGRRPVRPIDPTTTRPGARPPHR